MERVERDGKVAVLVSSGYGAGWSTWNREYPQLLTHPKLVAMVEAGRQEEITAEYLVAEGIVPGSDDGSGPYCGGALSLHVEWIPKGKPFQVTEYDGAEGIQFTDDFITFT